MYEATVAGYLVSLRQLTTTSHLSIYSPAFSPKTAMLIALTSTKRLDEMTALMFVCMLNVCFCPLHHAGDREVKLHSLSSWRSALGVVRLERPCT